ncbi:MAG: HU family DNA-binding protein [Bdellovibrionota bacterium]|nr:HU family DNA-binding protein [Bdellovibrionota bacterium]
MWPDLFEDICVVSITYKLNFEDQMTKADLINHISEQANITRVKAETVINTIFDSMVEALSKGDRIEIRGFGSFVNRQYGAYKGRNPRTGEVIEVKQKQLPFFKVGKELKDAINDQKNWVGPLDNSDD